MAVNPSLARSKKLRKRVFLLPLFNLQQSVVFGSVFAVVGLMLGLHLPGRHVGLGPGRLWNALWGSPLLVLLLGLVTTLIAGLTAFAHDSRGLWRPLVGTLYGLAQLTVLSVVMIIASRLTPGTGAGDTTAFFGLVLFGGGFVSTFTLSTYLWVANHFGLHDNEAYAPLHHKDDKGFLRFHLDREGVLHMFPIAVDRVGRKWKTDPDSPPDSSWIVPDGPDPSARLIEPPVRFEPGRPTDQPDE